jgi:transcriptional regulator of acetoin/glycerol metabolism
MSALETTKALISQNSNQSLNAIADIWEKFVGTGELNDNRLRPVIVDRWLKCRDLGINPLIDRAQFVISNDEIENKLYTENLGVSGKNILDRMENTVKDTEHVIVLADKTGKIIYSVGHQQIQKHLEKINFRPGCEWDENSVGPNGVGTPLALGQPELILGSEHFCQGWQPWVCYGAPIHNPADQSVIGCIDITGPVNKVSVEAMALAISITHSIESDLSLSQLKKREKLRLAYRDFQMKWPNNASFSVDEFGYIIDINAQTYSFLSEPETMLNRPVQSFFPELTVCIEECLKNGLEREFELELHQAFTDHVRLLIKPLIKRNETFGCFVMLLNNHRQPISSSLQSNEDELIRKALLKANGNVSKAARILNIDRTTIYRRRKNWQN